MKNDEKKVDEILDGLGEQGSEQDSQQCASSESEDEITKLQNELSDVTDRFYRASADFENIKKRMEKEKENALAYANEKFSKDLLPVIDALEEALKIDVEGNELATKIKDGLTQCMSMMEKSFQKHGIESISTDEGFNPEIHNAINMVEVEGAKSGDIVQVYQKGYMYKNRVLRASMVVIAK